ncbi:MAG: ATPase P, partial [Bacteroidetes bacterium SW_10_40_5]
IKNYYAEKQPAEKLKLIEELASKEATAMVGDGINDAPSLSRANIGVSLSSGTEIAIQSAEVVLLNGKLSSLVDAHRLSKTTLTTIKQNLFWAFFYNVMVIPLAAIGLLNPMIAALAMAFSDVIVVGNSIRLKYRPLTKG